MALAITLKNNESVLIGDNVVIKVQRMAGQQNKLYIEAPRTMKVYRLGELDELTNREAIDAHLKLVKARSALKKREAAE